MPENRRKTGQFMPGKSGNPGGRPKLGEQERAARETLKSLCVEAVEHHAEAPLSLRLRAAELTVDAESRQKKAPGLCQGFRLSKKFK